MITSIQLVIWAVALIVVYFLHNKHVTKLKAEKDLALKHLQIVEDELSLCNTERLSLCSLIHCPKNAARVLNERGQAKRKAEKAQSSVDLLAKEAQ